MPILSLLTTTRSRLLSSTAFIRYYAAGGFNPEFVADFVRGKYSAAGNSTFASTINHSATGLATMTDENGNLVWRPHNLALQSGDIATSWAASGISAVSATRIEQDSSTGFHRMSISAQLAVGAKYTFETVAYAGEENIIGLSIYDGSAFAARASFNLSTGVVAGTNDGTAEIEDLGGGEYLCRVYGVATNTSGTLYVSSGSVFTFAGSAGDGVYTDKRRLYRSDLGGMVNNPDRGDSYVPTTSSVVYLPRIGHHVYNGSQWVDEGVFHESEARTNLFVQSNDFSTQSAVRSTITDNSSTSPDGTVSAARFEDTATSGDHRLDFTTFTVTSGNTYTYSIFAKAAELDWVRMWFSSDFGTQYANFDLSTGSIGVTTGIISANIEPVSNGFYRCSIVGTATSTGSNNQRLQLATDDNMVSFTGDGASGVLIYGAQFEAGSTPSSYIPTSGATATRAAETLTIPYENLTWPEPVVIGDELVTNGTFDADTDWIKGTDWAFDAVNLRAERTGTTYQNLQQALTLSTGEAYVFSFTKGGAGLVQAFLDGKTFNATAAGEYVFTFVYSGGSTNLQFGTNSADVDIDNVSVREIKPRSVSIQMDGRMTYADEDQTTEFEIISWLADSSNSIRLRLTTGGALPASTGDIDFVQRANGVSDRVVSMSNLLSPGVLVPFNIASRHGSTFINGAVDGVALTEDTTPVALPDLSTTDLQLGYDFMGTIKKFRMWADDIGDTGIEEATEPSLEPSLSLTFDGSSTSFTVFDWSE